MEINGSVPAGFNEDIHVPTIPIYVFDSVYTWTNQLYGRRKRSQQPQGRTIFQMLSPNAIDVFFFSRVPQVFPYVSL